MKYKVNYEEYNKFPIFLAKIKTYPNGTREVIRDSIPYKEIIFGTAYNEYLFNLREDYFNKPNCNFNCPSGREFFCCKEFDCKKNHGFFEWDEISFFSEEEREKILSLWNNGMGFQRKDGCALPRELRSYICLTFTCGIDLSSIEAVEKF